VPRSGPSRPASAANQVGQVRTCSGRAPGARVGAVTPGPAAPGGPDRAAAGCATQTGAPDEVWATRRSTPPSGEDSRSAAALGPLGPAGGRGGAGGPRPARRPRRTDGSTRRRVAATRVAVPTTPARAAARASAPPLDAPRRRAPALCRTRQVCSCFVPRNRHQARALALIRAVQPDVVFETEEAVPESSRWIDVKATFRVPSEAWGVLGPLLEHRVVYVEHFSEPPSERELTSAVLEAVSGLDAWLAEPAAARSPRPPVGLVLSDGCPYKALALLCCVAPAPWRGIDPPARLRLRAARRRRQAPRRRPGRRLPSAPALPQGRPGR